MHAISIRFPLVKERTGNRRGPRFRRMPDKIGLHGAALCACSMLRAALISREAFFRERTTGYARWQRVQMRCQSLWARVFAGQIRDDDPRLLEAEALARSLVEQKVHLAAA